jgi:hypothetical protein
MRSAARMVDRRCAMTIDVRPVNRGARAAWMSCSETVSRFEVASSSSRIRGSLRITRAIETRCFSPPESRWPRSPTTVS